jgi:transcriptional regulator with XRE-family HTH domain
MEMFIHENLKLMRQRLGLTQRELADRCGLTRSKVAAYECQTQPTLSAMLQLSDELGLSVDVLLREDLSQWGEFKFRQHEQQTGGYVTGEHMRILATTVNEDNDELAEMVNEKARAGYLQAFADPEFISDLPRIHLPMLSKNKKHRAFQVHGDSMPPIKHQDWVIGSYVENWLLLKDGERYVFVTDEDGVILKTVYKKMAENHGFLMISSNPLYKPFYLQPHQVREVWKVEWWFTGSIE